MAAKRALDTSATAHLARWIPVPQNVRWIPPRVYRPVRVLTARVHRACVHLSRPRLAATEAIGDDRGRQGRRDGREREQEGREERESREGEKET